VKRPWTGAFWLLLLVFLPGPGTAFAQARPARADDGIRVTLKRWYEELAKKEKGRLSDIVAPGFIEASPTYRHVDTGARKLGPRVYTALPARALQFAWEIDSIRRDSTFAKVQVWERGYFYAFAAQETYENAAATTFVLERRGSDGRWLILAHQSGGYGIPPNKITDPMPDLRALFYATEGIRRDPDRDASEARKNRW
jgi:hypothetical protein